MKQVYRLDANGFYIEPVILNDDSIPSDCVEATPPEGIFKLQYVNGAWQEGATQDEINTAKNVTAPMDETKKQLADLTFTLMLKGVI